MGIIIDDDGIMHKVYTKADMVTTLIEIQTEIEEIEVAEENTEIRAGESCMKGACIDLIQQKIDKLRGEQA